MTEGQMFGRQSDKTRAVNVEDRAVMVGGRTVPIVCRGCIVIVMMCRHSMMVSIRINGQRVDNVGVIRRKTMCVRRLGGDNTSPDDRCGHNGRHDLADRKH